MYIARNLQFFSQSRIPPAPPRHHFMGPEHIQNRTAVVAVLKATKSFHSPIFSLPHLFYYRPDILSSKCSPSYR